MIRQWLEIMLMAMLVLIQTACPKFLVQQHSDVAVHPSDDQGGSG
jgi:hypothetical protein